MKTPEPPFALTLSDRQSELWNRLEAYWKARVEMLRSQNDGDKDPIQTAKLRGQIAELKTTLALGRDPIEIKPPPN